ncbi:MAG: acyl-CoA synthetase, partial [Stutzerimonas stutzeri]
MHPHVHAEAMPDKAALILATTGETIRYADLEARANRLAHAFRDMGLANGDAVALVCDNRPEYLDIYWAAQRSGLILVPVSARLKPDEIAYIANDSLTRLLILSDALAETAQGLEAIRETMPGVAEIATIGPVPSFTDLLARAATLPATRIADERIGGRMTYSSGTTGRPKGIRYAPAEGSPVQPNPGAALFGRLYGLDAETVYLSPAPLYHSAPLGITAGIQALGGTVVLMPKFEPEAFLATVERWK